MGAPRPVLTTILTLALLAATLAVGAHSVLQRADEVVQ